ncbi:hypothetical protein MHB40_20375 [Lysinibacillus sp. FSL K6-0057]|uniref:hypothetical protein n=1 Tax=Lysinibacillus sp. FSL K6-0057 TaxID=2921411 RepID=UPI00315A9E89
MEQVEEFEQENLELREHGSSDIAAEITVNNSISQVGFIPEEVEKLKEIGNKNSGNLKSFLM